MYFCKHPVYTVRAFLRCRLKVKTTPKNQLWNVEKLIKAVEAYPCPAPELPTLYTNKKGILLIFKNPGASSSSPTAAEFKSLAPDTSGIHLSQQSSSSPTAAAFKSLAPDSSGIHPSQQFSSSPTAINSNFKLQYIP